MGIPLYQIRGIRQFYNQDLSNYTPINFDTAIPRLLPGHVIACRITAENPDAQFQPTSGMIVELNFRSTPNVWGYFSISSNGGVHEFSDSQFGHLFALGTTREHARRNMSLALKELSIRGDIRTTVEYLRMILENDDFKNNYITTTWLEKIMKSNTIFMDKPATHLIILLGALFNSYHHCSMKAKEYMNILNHGGMPSSQLHNEMHTFENELIYEGIKYILKVYKSGPNSYDITMMNNNPKIPNAIDLTSQPRRARTRSNSNANATNDDLLDLDLNWSATADVLALADDGLLIMLNGKKYVIYGKEFSNGLRLIIDGKTCVFQKEYDPTILKADMQGKLVRYLVADGSHIEKGQAYCEVEVMKMYLSMLAPESGYITHKNVSGAIIEAGVVLATLSLDYPDKVEKAELFQHNFPKMGPPTKLGDKTNVILNDCLNKLKRLLSGYKLGVNVANKLLRTCISCLRDPTLPYHEFQSIFSTLSGRLGDDLYATLYNISEEYYHNTNTNRFYWEPASDFPINAIQDAIDNEILKLSTEESQKLLTTIETSGLSLFLSNYQHGNAYHAANVLCSLLQEYYDVESHFSQHPTLAAEDVIKLLRKNESNSSTTVAHIARANYQLKDRSKFIVSVLDTCSISFRPMLHIFLPYIKKLSQLSGQVAYGSVILKCRQLIIQNDMPSNEQRKISLLTFLNSAATEKDEQTRLNRLVPLIDQSESIEDIIFPFFNHQNQMISKVAFEAYVRRMYHMYTIEDLNVNQNDKNVTIVNFHFHFDDSTLDTEHIKPKTTTTSTLKKKFNRIVSYQDLNYLNDNAVENDTSLPVANAEEEEGKGVPSPQLASPLPQQQGSLQDDDVKSNKSSSAAAVLHNKSDDDDDYDYIITHNESRKGILLYFKDGYQSVKRHLSNVLQSTIQINNDINSIPVNVLYIAFVWNENLPADESLSDYFTTLLTSNQQILQYGGFRRVTFTINNVDIFNHNLHFTFRQINNQNATSSYYHQHADQKILSAKQLYIEDIIVRHIEPSYAFYMELHKLSNYQLEVVPTSNYNVHLFSATPSTWKKSSKNDTYKGQRLFSRTLVRNLDSILVKRGLVNFASLDFDDFPEIEQAFVQSLDSLEMAIACNYDVWRNNHVFINILVASTMELLYVENAIRLLSKRYSQKINRLNVTNMELFCRFVVKEDDDEIEKKLFYRFICSNDTGSILDIDIYEEIQQGHGKYYKLISKKPLYRTPYFDQKHITTPYPTLELDEIRIRREIAKKVNTTYVYDFINLFDRALNKIWFRTNGQVTKDSYLLSVDELILNPKNKEEVIKVQRPIGLNNIGMIAWLLTISTPESPSGRQIIVIANDISFQMGTFGTQEDDLFYAASKYARTLAIPRIYLSANSGARIGLAEDIRNKYQIAWKDNDIMKGIDYIYLSDEDYQTIGSNNVNIKTMIINNEKRHIITDIIGKQHGIGVENLSGSGKIAGETSKAYEDIFTLTYITGRCVGIGAYLARLGQK